MPGYMTNPKGRGKDQQDGLVSLVNYSYKKKKKKNAAHIESIKKLYHFKGLLLEKLYSIS